MSKKVIFLAGLLFLSSGVFSQELQLKVLVLHSSSVDMPWVEAFNSGIEDFREANFPNIRFFFEFMGKDFTGNALDDDDWVFYLGSKYSEEIPDFIIADSAEAVLLLSENPELFPGVPKVMRSVFQPEDPDKLLFYISSDIKKAVAKTWELAMRQNPGAETVVIIDGQNLQSANIIRFFQEDLLSGFDGRLVVLNDFTIEELLSEVSGLEPGTIIFYTAVMKDRMKAGLVPRDVLRSVCGAAPVPVYTFWNTLMGTGAVGGSMLDAETIAKEMCRAGMDYLGNGEFGGYYEILHTYLDWTAMKRFGIRAEDETATVINKPVSIFVYYSKQIITGGLIFSILLSAAGFILLTKYRKLNSILGSERSELETLLDDKSMLIREIDHRVKNNLAILRDLVDLQQMSSDEPEVKADLLEVSGRISVMALVHEKLFKAERENNLDTRQYFEELVEQIARTMLAEPSRVSIHTDIRPVPVNVKTAMTCGLIVNELLTNAIKYAFPGEYSGTITVIIGPLNDHEYEIVVRDDGIGLPEKFDPAVDSALGLKVVQQLSSQLKGRLQIEGSDGTEFRLTLTV